METIKVFVFGQWHDAELDKASNLVWFNGVYAPLNQFDKYLRVIQGGKGH